MPKGEKREQLTNEQLTERIIELGALLGAFQKHFFDFRSGVNRDLDKALDRITALEDRPWNPCATCHGEICGALGYAVAAVLIAMSIVAAVLIIRAAVR